MLCISRSSCVPPSAATLTMFRMLAPLIPAIVIHCAFTQAQLSVSIDIIPGQTFMGPSSSQLASGTSGFDAPKVSHLNSTSFDWWYFDVVASDLSASAVFNVFTADITGLWPGLPAFSSAVWIAGLFSFPNGTDISIFLPADDLTVVTVENGSSGTLQGLNGGWKGTPNMSYYVVTIDEPGIQGTLSLHSVGIGVNY